MDRRDIHSYAKWLDQAKQRISALDIPEENKRQLLEFDEGCALEGLSVARRSKLLFHLIVIARKYLPVEFSRATKEDIRKAVSGIEASHYAAFTRRDMKISIRKLFKWIYFKEEALTRKDFPDLVAWIRINVNRKELRRIQAADLLTPDEIDRMIQSETNQRNRAFIAVLYELGARIGEVGSLRLRDVTRDQYSLLIDLDGKTGKRTVRVIGYASELVAWMNSHPARDDPMRPLWPSIRPFDGLTPLPYRELKAVIKRAAHRAKINKRVYPHLLRHSRATHLLAAGNLNEAQAKVFFGWVPDTKVMATYAHLVARDANDAVLRMYGVERNDDAGKPRAIACGMCRAPNPARSKFCYQCGYALDRAGVGDVQKRTESADELLQRFLSDSHVRDLFKKMIRESRFPDSHGKARPSSKRRRAEDDA